MKNVRHNEQLGNPMMLGVVFVHVVHMWRVMQPETEDQALYDDFFATLLGCFWARAFVESVISLYEKFPALLQLFTLFD